jgi:hypothetical protein
VSASALQALYDNKAFKSAPSLWELAQTHVDFASVGFASPPEPRLLSGLGVAEGVSLLSGPFGSGKSSVLAHIALALAGTLSPERPDLTFLPIFVPVVAVREKLDIERFGQGAIREVLLAIGSALSKEYRDKLEQGKAKRVLRQATGAVFNARLAAKLFDSGADVGFRLAGDVATIVDEQSLDSSGGIKTLGDIARANGRELVLFVEDTDAWAFEEGEGRERARAFFGGVGRRLTSDVDVAVAIAAQTHWFKDDPLAEVQRLAERAMTIAEVPKPSSLQQARTLVEAILDRRIEISLEGTPPRATDLFSAEVLDALGHEVFETGSVRVPLTKVRDVLDHADVLPEMIEMDHLLESL